MTETARPDVDAAIGAIGGSLAEIRSLRRLRVSELARRAGVSPSLISQIERGASKPSVGTLFALAQVLEVSVDHFFSRESAELDVVRAAASRRVESGRARAARPAADILERAQGSGWATQSALTGESDLAHEVVRHADRASLDIRGGVRWERLTPAPLDGIEFLELIYQPGAESDSHLYRHPGIELVLVISGVMTIFLGFAQNELHPGDSISFASSVPHRYTNLTAQEAHAVTVILRDDLSHLPIRDQARARPQPDRAPTAPTSG